MCGVAGILNYKDETPADADLLQRMVTTIHHRGPDDGGLWVSGPVGLGHRRLTIVDLSPTGKQPMLAPNGTCAISYNGEFYNHASFRPMLEAKGVHFRGTSDTETLLHLLKLRGPDALADVAGIFAFAFWDSNHRRLILGRDPLGVKQIYYHDDGRRIVFASEIKALLVDPRVKRELDPRGLNEYLHFHTPLFDRTFFRNIRQVRAGEYVEVNASGAREKAYWQVDGFEPRDGSPEQQVGELKSLVGSVVREQLMSDVPVGAFFSGGIDSTAVAAFASRAGKNLQCFGVHFANQGVIDERPFQEGAARALGLPLELTTLDGSSFPDDLARLMYYQDQPVVGPALLPMYYVSRLAARKVKVCLGGQAADETFAGYARYALASPARVFGSWFSGRRGDASSNGAREGAPVGGNLVKQLRDGRNLRRLAATSRNFFNWRKRYFEHFATVPEAEWQALLADAQLVSRRTAYDQFLEHSTHTTATDPTSAILHWELRTYLTALFQQDDRMSMANSLESRVPLADPRVVRFAMHTPTALKLRAGATKWILRQAVADVIPAEVLNRRKVGFDTPAEAWLRGPHREFLCDVLLSSRSRGRGWFNPRAVERLIADGSRPSWFFLIWKLLSIELWARVFLDEAAVFKPQALPHAEAS
jgi:asparagine synthase (glutamine-hydrolysing)